MLVVALVYVTDDETRVQLAVIPGVEGSDYINASWINVSLLNAMACLYLSMVCYLFVCVCVCLPVCPSVRPSVRLSLSVCLL
jgi:hypothetical protein